MKTNSLVLLFLGKSILHVSCKQDVECKPKSSQISCLVISSSKNCPRMYFSLQYFPRVFGDAFKWNATFLAVVTNRVV